MAFSNYKEVSEHKIMMNRVESIIRIYTEEKLKDEDITFVVPAHLARWENEFVADYPEVFEIIKQKFARSKNVEGNSKNHIRYIMNKNILDNYGVQKFGRTPLVKTGEITEETVKKVQRKLRKG